MEKKKKLLGDQEKQASMSAGQQMAMGFIGAAESGANAMMKNIVSMAGKMAGPVGEVIAGAINLLSSGYDAMKKLFTEYIANGPEFITGIFEGMLGAVDGMLEGVLDWFSDPQQWVRMIDSIISLVPKIVTSIAKALPKILLKALDINFWREVAVGAVKAFLKALQDMFASLWDLITGDLGSAVTTAFTNGIKGAGEALMGFTDEMFAVVSDTAGGLTGDGDSNLMSSAEEIGFNIWEAFIKALKAGWDWILQIGEKIWEGLKSMAGDIWDFFKNAGSAVWEGLKGLAGSLGTTLKDAFLGAWDALKGAFGSVGTVIWDSITGILSNIKGAFSSFFDIDIGKAGTVEKWAEINIPFLEFAEGGPVPHLAGMGPVSSGNSYGNDKVNARLSPGEYVLNREITGDNSKMSRIMDIINGREQNFFLGGAVKALDTVTGGAVSNTVSSVTDTAGSGFGLIEAANDLIYEAGEKTGINDALESVEDMISSLSSELKAVWDFLVDDIGANIDISDFIDAPQNIFKNIMNGAAAGFLEPAASGMMEFIGNQSKFHTGGLVGNDGMANILGGEFVMNRQAVSQIGAANLGNLNRAALTGGTGNMGSGDIIFEGDINVTTNQMVDDQFIRNELMPTFMGEIKDKSQRGEFVISSKGIRT